MNELSSALSNKRGGLKQSTGALTEKVATTEVKQPSWKNRLKKSNVAGIKQSSSIVNKEEVPVGSVIEEYF